ncbi:MAG TPA: DUF5916 domain-containing protein [Capsulimonadaceae bacterium]|nr:DUF5916 domain-containing protein [Capsulimonadaceae bacterium]
MSTNEQRRVRPPQADFKHRVHDQTCAFRAGAAFFQRHVKSYPVSIDFSRRKAQDAPYWPVRGPFRSPLRPMPPAEGTFREMRLKTIIAACLLASLLWGDVAPTHAQPMGPGATSTVWKREEISIPLCSKPPKIDGALDDDCWKNTAHAEQFFRFTSPVVQQTEAWITADSSHLYVAFRCMDSDPRAIRAMETQRNGNTWVDDYVCVDIDSQNERHSFSQFIVTARGTQNENLEGGTADNITWAGDWHAATQRDKDGWTCEVSIPFALLRYPRGSRSFGIQLERKLARETTSEFWPDRPSASQTNPVEYFGELTDIDPVFYRPQPIFLPYTLVSAGEGNSTKAGLDIKYPLTSGLTGLATFHPDFGTVEQSVTGISFSYSQKFIQDQRPFFAEGSGFFPYSDIFYSPSISNVDAGLKVTGKEGATSIGALSTVTNGAAFQRASVLSLQHDLNPLSNLEFDFAGDDQAGLQSNQVIKTQARYGWHAGQDQWNTTFTHSQSWLGGGTQGGQEFYQLQWSGKRGHPSLGWQYNAIAPNFDSDLGFVPYENLKGMNFNFSQNNTFDKGYWQHYSLFGTYLRQNHWTGGFFRANESASLYANTHNGNGLYLGISQGRFEDFHDHVNEYYIEWSNNSSYGSGNIDYQKGAQDGQGYEWWSVSQGYGFNRKFSVNFNYNWQKLGSTITTQGIYTPLYKLTADKAIGGRIVTQNSDTDIFLSFAQKVRAGSDIFVLFGDPNSPRTRGLIQLKVVSPF